MPLALITEDEAIALRERAEKAEAELFERFFLHVGAKDDIAQVSDLTRRLDEARDVLRAVEWAGPMSIWHTQNIPTCPDCEAPQHQGHSAGCDLAAVLRGDPIPDRLAAGAREAVARAIFSRLWGAMPDVFGPAFEHDQDLFQLAADDAIRALRDTPAPPETGGVK